MKLHDRAIRAYNTEFCCCFAFYCAAADAVDIFVARAIRCSRLNAYPLFLGWWRKDEMCGNLKTKISSIGGWNVGFPFLWYRGCLWLLFLFYGDWLLNNWRFAFLNYVIQIFFGVFVICLRTVFDYFRCQFQFYGIQLSVIIWIDFCKHCPFSLFPPVGVLTHDFRPIFSGNPFLSYT